MKLVDLDINVESNTDNILTELGELFINACKVKQHKKSLKKLLTKRGVSCSKDSFVVNHPPAGGFQTKFCGKSPAIRVADKR